MMTTRDQALQFAATDAAIVQLYPNDSPIEQQMSEVHTLRRYSMAKRLVDMQKRIQVTSSR